MSDASDFQYGKGNTIPVHKGDYPVYGCNGIVGTTDCYNSENSPIIGHIGSAGIVNWGEGKHFVTYNGTICKAKEEVISSKYLYYLLQNMHLEQYVKGNQPFLSYGDFSKAIIVIPSKQRQDKIVFILESLCGLCESMEEGIPAEIEARQKQYEYYRDKLLSFKEA